MPKKRILCKIRQFLDSKRLTQASLAIEAKVDPGDLSRIINGRRNPRATAAVRLARVLGTTVESLWPESTPKRHK